MQLRYVSPSGNNANSGLTSGQAWATVAFAKAQVRDLISANPTESVTVYVMGTRNSITSTLAFTADDSPQYPGWVSWLPRIGEDASISGGIVVDTWTEHDAGLGIWVADYEGDEFRQLYVDGIRCFRPQRIGGLINGTATDAGFNTTDPVTNYANLSDVEFVFRLSGGWRESRVKVATAVSNTSLTMAQPAQANYIPIGSGDGTRFPYAIENAYEILELGKPATFYWDRAEEKIYLIPPVGVDDPNDSEVIIPVVNKLVTMDDGAQRIAFSIPLEHNSWIPQDGGFGDIQAMIINDGAVPDSQYVDYYGNTTPAAVEVRNSRQIEFTDMAFRHLGSHALAILDNCELITVARNLVWDVSGNGVILGRPHNLFLSNAPSRVTVENNLFYYTGQEYHGTCGLFAPYVAGAIVRHNDFESLPYDGIGWGWGWGNINQHAILPAINNKLLNNKLANTCLEMHDGGAIYSVGMQHGLLIDGNYIYNLLFGVGIYMDSGSYEFTITNNLAAFYNPYWLQLHKAFGNCTIANNHSYYPAGTAFSPYDANWHPLIKTVQGAVEWTPAEPALYTAATPTAAQAAIISNAGRQAGYRTALPSMPSQASAFVSHAVGGEVGWWLPSEIIDAPGVATAVEDKIGSNDLTGTLSLVTVPGNGGSRRALRLNGTNQKFTGVAYTDNTSVAWSFWFYKTPGNQSGALIALGTNDGVAVLGIGSTTLDSDGSNLVLAKQGSYWVTETAALTAGWHHVVMHIDGDSTTRVYLDGDLAITDSQGYMGAPSGSFNFGDDGGSTRFLNTLIDDIRYFTEDLTSAKRAQLAYRVGATDEDVEEEEEFESNAVGGEVAWWMPSEEALDATTINDKIGSVDLIGTFEIVADTASGGVRAAEFNGTSEKISGTAFTDVTSVAWSFWFYKSADNQSGTLLGLGTGAGGAMLGIGSTTHDANGSNLVMGKAEAYWVTGTHALTTGWHHCLLQIDGSSIATVYIDNTLVITDGQGAMEAPFGTFNFGDDGYGSRYLATKIDDMRYFTEVLDSTKRGKLAARRGASE
jgi:hypothetical protein